MEFDLTIYQILLRLLLAVLFAGCIGFDREFKNRPAGMRTHVLVCIGATVIALIQKHIELEAMSFAVVMPELMGIVRADPARLIAQVVSGIGFLGAGTIIVTKRSITGLTTAASLWAVAGLGLALGMGYYTLAISSFVAILLVLSLWQKVIRVPSVKQLEIRYVHSPETKEAIERYFREKRIEVKDVDYVIDMSKQEKICTNVYSVSLPKETDYNDVMEDLSGLKRIQKVRSINL